MLRVIHFIVVISVTAQKVCSFLVEFPVPLRYRLPPRMLYRITPELKDHGKSISEICSRLKTIDEVSFETTGANESFTPLRAWR